WSQCWCHAFNRNRDGSFGAGICGYHDSWSSQGLGVCGNRSDNISRRELLLNEYDQPPKASRTEKRSYERCILGVWARKQASTPGRCCPNSDSTPRRIYTL